MATRKFRTKTGRVVEFETGGRRRGRGKAAEDAGAAHRGEASGEDGGGSEQDEAARREAAGTEALGQDGTPGGGAEETPGGGGDGDRGEAGRETGEEARRTEARAAEEQERREQAPGSVAWKTVSPEREVTPPATGLTAALAQLSDFAYRVPQLMGLGDHWPLAEFEARQMGRALEGCIKALPQKSKANTVKVLSRWLPWISLITTGYIVTMPRIMITTMGRRGSRGDAQSTHGPAAPGRDVREPGASPDGPYGNLPTWEDYRGHVGR